MSNALDTMVPDKYTSKEIVSVSGVKKFWSNLRTFFFTNKPLFSYKDHLFASKNYIYFLIWVICIYGEIPLSEHYIQELNSILVSIVSNKVVIISKCNPLTGGWFSLWGKYCKFILHAEKRQSIPSFPIYSCVLRFQRERESHQRDTWRPSTSDAPKSSIFSELMWQSAKTESVYAIPHFRNARNLYRNERLNYSL